MTAAVLALALLLSAPAQAHPNALRIVAHASELHVTVSEARLRYAVSLPPHGGHHDTPSTDGQSLEQTQSGLTLTGAEALTWSLTEGPRTTGAGAQEIGLVGAAPRVADDLVLEDANYPDLPGTFQGRVTVGPGLEVVACSLFTERDGEVRASRAGRWQLGDGHRRLTVTVRERDGLVERTLDLLAPPPEVRTAWQSRPAQGVERLWRLTPLSWVLALLLASATAPLAVHERKRDLGAMAASGLAAIALSVLPGPWSWAVPAVTTLALLSPRTRPALLALLPLAALGAPGPVAVGACVALAVAGLAGTRSRPLRWPVVLFGLVALARGIATL
ncbi:MAG: hypothetical protein EP330_05620 [Deltaproteobacteria bacterium]|nr:MAG: hypothetical protein EP330_05620 [Deltaproteobacteria bacterium]